MKTNLTPYPALICCALALACSTPTTRVNHVADNNAFGHISVAASYSSTAIRENPCAVKTHDSKINSITSLLKDIKDWANQCINDAMFALAD